MLRRSVLSMLPLPLFIKEVEGDKEVDDIMKQLTERISQGKQKKYNMFKLLPYKSMASNGDKRTVMSVICQLDSHDLGHCQTMSFDYWLKDEQILEIRRRFDNLITNYLTDKQIDILEKRIKQEVLCG